jgi:hypothetical protein
MTNDIHRVVQNSAHDDDRLALLLRKPKQDDVPPSSPIPAYMQGIKTLCDIRPSPGTQGSWTLAQPVQASKDELSVGVCLSATEALGRPAKNLSDIVPGGLGKPDSPVPLLQPRRSPSASRASNANCSRNSSLVSKSR